MTTPRRPYPSDLGSAEWQFLEPLLPLAQPGGRHRGCAPREIVNAIQYLIGVGGAWRSLPRDLPRRQSVHHYFRSRERDGTWLRVHDHLHGGVRELMGRDVRPSAAIIGSQSVKATGKGGSTVTTGPGRSAGGNAISSPVPRGF
jgi:putative transposase